MADDGSGNFSLPSAPFVASTTATAATVNANFSDIATALTARVTRNGSGSMSGNLAMGTNRVTGLGNGTARTDAASVAQLQDSAPLWGGTAGGTADALTVTLTPAIAAYAAGQRFAFLSASVNTGAATLNVNGVGTKNIRKGTGSTALVAGDIPAGTIVEVIYDGTQFVLQRGPAIPTSASGVPGTFALINPGDNTAVTLPAGGYWKWFVYTFSTVGGTWQATDGGIAVGGSVVRSASSGNRHEGWCERFS